jgi:fused signal recognition particle receptor
LHAQRPQLSGGLSGVFTKERLDADTIKDLEDALIKADIGRKPLRSETCPPKLRRDRYDTEHHRTRAETAFWQM